MNTPFPHTPASPAVLLVDDEIHALQSYEMQLLGEGIGDCICCLNGAQALEVLEAQEVGLILLDLRMPGMSGEDVLELVNRQYPHIPVLVISALDDVETAVRCIRLGAFNYIVKPVEPTRLMTEVKRGLEVWELRRENVLLRESVLNRRVRHPEAFAELLTASENMHAIFRYIESIAPSTQPVLVTGETGVGKEMIVQAIHQLSGRAGQFCAVNVAGLDDPTFSDTLFGHKRGAFTGADRARDGIIERAAKGTLFLDEIGDLSLQSQVKLLRLLQEREYYQLGADLPKPTTARVIVATNRDLLALQEEGKFRPDLYYRLVLHRIHVPPLRERRADVPLLLDFFLAEAAQELRKPVPALPPELFTLLAVYAFPGNIRELRALVFDAMSHHVSGTLALSSFKAVLRQSSKTGADTPVTAKPRGKLFADVERLPTLEEVEDSLIAEALERTGGNQSLTATLLGITRQTLHRRLKAAAQP